MVLLSHGYFLQDDPKEQAIMKPYPPLGLLYLAAWLDQHGVENAVHDTTFSSKKALLTRIAREKPAIVALYTNLMTKPNILDIIRQIRQNPDTAHCLIVLGGPDVTHNAANYLAYGADLLVVGEGEQTLLEVAFTAAATGHVLDHAAFQHIQGLVYKLPDGSLYHSPPREKIRDIDELPMPARHKIDLGQYLDAWQKAHGQRAISISTQRGCPYTCRWCSTAVYGQSYRRRSPRHVADEIAWLQANYTFDLIWFVDDVFTVSHKWIGEFKAELAARSIQMTFECITRADRLNDAVLQQLRDMGCFRVWIGAESGSQRIIDAMDRRVDVRQVRDMIRAARQKGIQAGTFIMLGYPGETEADVVATLEHLKASDPDLFTITVAYPIKGTGLYESVQENLEAPSDWAAHTDRDLDFVRQYPRRYYDFAVRWTVNSVHLHKARRAGKGISPRAAKLWLKVLAARVGMLLAR
jgi:anaerobic magnesium-protoporphyrin IX monomethyl ester cyclase